MKTLKILVLATLLAALPPIAVAGDEESTENTTASLEIGATGVDVDGSPDKAAEYYSTEDSPSGTFRLDTFQGWGSLDADIDYLATDEHHGNLNVDIKRMVRSHNTFTKFPHRLGHDPMHNLEATSINGKVVQHTDFSPNQDYDFEYSVFRDRTEFQFPNLKALTLAVEYRDQRRDGHTQAFTTSHCDTCHTKSQSHRMDQKTTDGTFEAAVGWKNGVVRASVTSRELREGTSSVDVMFDKNLHPELQVPVFDNRMQYDSDVGLVPADLRPNIDKDTSKLNFHWANETGLAISANAVWSETKNRYTDNEAEYSGYVASVAKRFKNNLRLRWRGKVYTTETNSVYIEPNVRVTPAGPHAGLTYQDVYGVTFDQWRDSTLNRDVLESHLDASYRLGRKGGTLRGLWKYSSVDREFYEVLPGEKETVTNLLGASYRVRPAKGLRFDVAYKHADISNAYTLINGACSTLVSNRYPNPWSPETPQYDSFHDARIAETTASPSSYDKAELGLSWVSGKSTISGRYVYWDGSNTDGDLTDWSRDRQTATVTLWSPIGEGWDWYLGYAYQDSNLDAPLCIPVFDG